MVRNIAGALKRVGTGHITPLELQRIMEAKERRNPPKMAPAHGLYLVDVHYDPRGNQFDGRLEDVNYRGGRYGDGSEDGSDDGSDDGSGDGSGDGSDDAGAGADDGSGEASSGPPPAPNDAGGGKGEGGGEAGGEGEWNDAAILSWATGGFRLVSVGSPSEDNIMVGVEKSTGECHRFSPTTGKKGEFMGHFNIATGSFTSAEITAEEAEVLRKRLEAHDRKAAAAAAKPQQMY
jgi:hypothetical protein